ncbi:fasciclin domain-containing protein [Nocardia cyriacigeorgica]|uniref:Fasciclin domain-containing protein n=1 Tax=Nocardia cyriacigeorgica TaxID=135487 RepID=A0A6P1DEI5_9NOCA|nr:fasciclin domain-containing protein [Nocardia cyriacigeorgica]NEW40013.1 fasciclin domain-containing protein [Nocardia cyriacigeorgica]NEW46832.1 fasciclin domain-containing protein [Nocardia cyriacigeorgica]NEW53627.1 fasciclin domain-containing protein [Nocardia cyriacigeorgica]
MRSNARMTVAAVGVGALALFGVAACTTDDSSSDSADRTTMPQMTTETMSPTTTDAAQANLVGPGCTEYAEQVPTGPGSIEGMSEEPVAVAASNNPMLTNLTAAVSGQLNPEVNLVDTLNGGEFTVFAPVDDAFAKVDPATIESLKTDSATLETILTYHVVPGRIAPDALTGTQTTVQGGTVSVTGSGDSLQVNGAAVICGGIGTANATVYLIDSILIPQ